MKIFSAFIFISLFFTETSFSQPADLSVHGETGKLYLLHNVVAKENWYSVGRIYNISPKEIAPFNALTIETPLKIGQELKIPLNNNNFSQDGKKNEDETFVAVYHAVAPNETFAHISAVHNKVAVENLEKWNKIKKDGAKEGMQIIVGFLKVKSSLSYLADKGIMNHDADAAMKNHDAEKPATVKEEKKTMPVAEKPQNTAKQTKATDNPKENTGDEKKQVFTTVSNTAHFNGSYFANDYNEGNNKITGLAGTFKSTSGWNDGKYYVLVNNIAVGTIVKIIAPATQKSIYAKVLGQLPDMKESEGLTVRISNAAASELGESEGKFNVQVRY
jgi:LysM domain-containing protein